MQRMYIKQYKDEMIDKKLIPIKITALNDLLKKCSQPGQHAPHFWDMIGRHVVLQFVKLLSTWKQQQANRIGQG